MDSTLFLAMVKRLVASARRWAPVPVLGPATYLLVSSLLRYRRLKQTRKEFKYPTRESYANMTDDDAWKIQLKIAQLEFPFMYLKALQFALFRVRSWPTASPKVPFIGAEPVC